MKRKFIVLLAVMLMVTSVFGGCSNSSGKILTLSEAYENNLISLDDIKNIAYYYQGTTFENFSPKPLTELDNATEKAIKITYLTKLKKDFPNAKMDDISPISFYGCYNGCFAVIIGHRCVISDPLIIPETYIGGVCFYNMPALGIVIWTAE